MHDDSPEPERAAFPMTLTEYVGVIGQDVTDLRYALTHALDVEPDPSESFTLAAAVVVSSWRLFDRAVDGEFDGTRDEFIAERRRLAHELLDGGS